MHTSADDSRPAVRSDIAGTTCTITIDRPDAMNALNGAVRDGLRDALARLDADDALRVGVLLGAGGRAFSAGADLKESARRLEAGVDLAARSNLGWFDCIRDVRKPLIAAIDGYCVAGGLEVALLCDIRQATRASVFAMPEPRRGLLSGPALHHLSRSIPLGEAMLLHLTGGRMTAERAYDIGLVQRLTDDRATLLAATQELAYEIATCSPAALIAIKQIVRQGRALPISEAERLAEPITATYMAGGDAFEGVHAFVERRTASFDETSESG